MMDANAILRQAVGGGALLRACSVSHIEHHRHAGGGVATGNGRARASATTGSPAGKLARTWLRTVGGAVADERRGRTLQSAVPVRVWARNTNPFGTENSRFLGARNTSVCGAVGR
ncbi:hypothetical protein PR202_ga06365 [Eleusine coracana subsp. coracana]|uniref:Uncharacterized protein n=1 Tax=Eleusine coracana subsp. coracana TaxID=191504 RepID=A0AAV5BVT5_ELECO|nr:hypothetical protein PR202_ga06365 [Eleusine coracana subsp. coracana]